MKLRQEQEDQRLKLEKKRPELERTRAEEERNRFDANRDTKRRKVALDEKNLDIEIEERRLAIAERNKMLEVLSGLAGSAWCSKAHTAALAGTLTWRFALRKV